MKIALDTNVLIRLITNDHKGQCKKAKELIEKYATKEIFIAYGVIWEVYCVLKSFYKYQVDSIYNIIEDFLNADEFYIENETAVRLALVRARKGQLFYDSLIGEVGALRNLKTYTFDKKLADNKNFIVVN